jgi:hypothetical protein
MKNLETLKQNYVYRFIGLRDILMKNLVKSTIIRVAPLREPKIIIR